MKRLPQIALLADGKRLHLQDGPIDLIIEAKGKPAQVRAAYDAAARRFTGLPFQAALRAAVPVAPKAPGRGMAAAPILASPAARPGPPEIPLPPANELQPDSDLGARLVTRDVGPLTETEIEDALRAGAHKA